MAVSGVLYERRRGFIDCHMRRVCIQSRTVHKSLDYTRPGNRHFVLLVHRGMLHVIWCMWFIMPTCVRVQIDVALTGARRTDSHICNMLHPIARSRTRDYSPDRGGYDTCI